MTKFKLVYNLHQFHKFFLASNWISLWSTWVTTPTSDPFGDGCFICFPLILLPVQLEQS